MITADGTEIVLGGEGAPSLRAIGQGLGRIPRFCGATRDWYPVLAHVFVVAALLPAELGVYGLLHDAPEAVVSDVPTPWKTDIARDVEHELYMRILFSLDLAHPDEAQQVLVDDADLKALAAEAHVLGLPHAPRLWPVVDDQAVALTTHHASHARVWLDASTAANAYYATVRQAILAATVISPPTDPRETT